MKLEKKTKLIILGMVLFLSGSWVIFAAITTTDGGKRGIILLILFLTALVLFVLLAIIINKKESYRIKKRGKDEIAVLRRWGIHYINEEGTLIGVLRRGLGSVDTFSPITNLASLSVTEGKKLGEYNVTLMQKKEIRSFKLTIEPLNSSRTLQTRTSKDFQTYASACKETGVGLKKPKKIHIRAPDTKSGERVVKGTATKGTQSAESESWEFKKRGAEREIMEPGRKRSYDVPGSNVDWVHFSLVSPASVISNTTFEIELYAHLAQQRQEIIKRAREVILDRKIKIKSKGPVFVSRGVILNVHLDIQGMKIEDPEDTILWEGDIGNASFLVHVPECTREGTYKGKALIFINGIQAARLLFMLNVGTSVSVPECLNIDVKRYKSAFTSYARKDRETVLNYIHGMMKVCPELKFNMDIMTLRSGEKFNDILFEYILESDIFYLFWSRAARDSQWVEKEWTYAYENKGIDFIDPIPLEPPELAPPPKPLSDYYHFNDWALAFKSLSHWRDH
jgi:hypothetical protein